MDENMRMVVIAVTAALPPTIASLTALIVAVKGNGKIDKGNEKIDKVNGNLMELLKSREATAEVKGAVDVLTKVALSPSAVVMPAERSPRPGRSTDRKPEETEH